MNKALCCALLRCVADALGVVVCCREFQRVVDALTCHRNDAISASSCQLSHSRATVNVSPRVKHCVRCGALQSVAVRGETSRSKWAAQSIIGALKAAAPKWKFELIKFVVCNCGSVVESDLYTKIKKLDLQEGKKKTSSSPIMWHRYAERTIGWLYLSSSKCKGLRGQPQRDRGRTSGTLCTCEGIERGTHAHRASMLGPV